MLYVAQSPISHQARRAVIPVSLLHQSQKAMMIQEFQPHNDIRRFSLRALFAFLPSIECHGTA